MAAKWIQRKRVSSRMMQVNDRSVWRAEPFVSSGVNEMRTNERGNGLGPIIMTNLV